MFNQSSNLKADLIKVLINFIIKNFIGDLKIGQIDCSLEQKV